MAVYHYSKRSLQGGLFVKRQQPQKCALVQLASCCDVLKHFIHNLMRLHWHFATTIIPACWTARRKISGVKMFPRGVQRRGRTARTNGRGRKQAMEKVEDDKERKKTETTVPFGRTAHVEAAAR